MRGMCSVCLWIYINIWLLWCVCVCVCVCVCMLKVPGYFVMNVWCVCGISVWCKGVVLEVYKVCVFVCGICVLYMW